MKEFTPPYLGSLECEWTDEQRRIHEAAQEAKNQTLAYYAQMQTIQGYQSGTRSMGLRIFEALPDVVNLFGKLR